ncbi:uncharacterized protein B0T23DRAFT_406061 [Neurospora hispaniola]|uniref:DUF3074 domain-containing protein n=1 Tax=Neurospora hispaniola TaxID=588809 RepID=A0AAJ0I2V9_9PEZI|nr:hypothetical protein B0T23DRAFT_406061 [Neurospora hispaniola]
MSIAGMPYPFFTGGPAYRSKVLVPSEEMDARNSREPDSHTNLISPSFDGRSTLAGSDLVMVTAAELGAPFLRLRGITTAHLPPPGTSPHELIPFLTALLRESVPFIDSVAPKPSNRPHQPTTESGIARSEWKPLKTKSSKVDDNGNTVVSLYERTLSAPELRAIERSAGLATSNTDNPETWACRRSVHRDSNVPGDGSASWGEFVTCFKDKHVECEEAFTPSIVGTRVLRDYDVAGLLLDDEHGDRYGNPTMKVVEARHKIGIKPLLKDRVFTVLQVTCSLLPREAGGAAADCDEILVISIPVSDIENFNTTAASPIKGKSSNKEEDPFRKDSIKGSYVSVERIRKLPTTENHSQAQIEWLMATASDARGSLPGWVQTMAVPGQIAKDVTLFLEWVAKEREKKGGLVA